MAYSIGNLSTTQVLFASFSQYSSSLMIGHEKGYKVYSLASLDNPKQINEDEGEWPDISLIERHYSSSLIALVSQKCPRVLRMCNIVNRKQICSYRHESPILAIKMSELRLVVVMEQSVCIHCVLSMKVLHTIENTPLNVNGVCALNAGNTISLLAHPGCVYTGKVLLFDVIHFRAVSTIQAHDSPLAIVSLSKEATLLATASKLGTLIRVFLVQSGSMLHEFRRGFQRCASINALAFSITDLFLAASSNTETVHIFKLQIPSAGSKPSSSSLIDDSAGRSVTSNHDSSWMGYVSKMLPTLTDYLPSPVSDVLKQERAFAFVRLPVALSTTVCSLIMIKKLLRVVVASSNGMIYLYNFNQEGGECPLVRQCSLNSVGDTGSKPLSPTANSSSNYADENCSGEHGSSSAENSTYGSCSSGSTLSDGYSSDYCNKTPDERILHGTPHRRSYATASSTGTTGIFSRRSTPVVRHKPAPMTRLK